MRRLPSPALSNLPDRLGFDRCPLGQNILQLPPALDERQLPQINSVEPDQIEGHKAGTRV